MADPRIWHAHIVRDLDRLQAGLLDLIDCGLPSGDTDVQLRRPTDDEVTETRRGQDTDADYATPTGPRGRTHHVSDPVGREVLRWHDAVANALAAIDELIVDWHEDAARAARRGGTTLPPPPAPVDLTEADDGHLRPIIRPSRARRAALARIRWLASAADAVVQHWEWEVDGDLIAFWADRTHVLRHATRTVARRHGRHHNRDVRCANPHGWKNHPVGDDPVDRVCATCRDPRNRCDSCGDQLPEDHDRRDCWSCVGKAKRRRQKQHAQSG